MWNLLKHLRLNVMIFGIITGYVCDQGIRAEALINNNHFLVIGVIASNKNQLGVALLKDQRDGRTFASREGQMFGSGATVGTVRRKTVEIILDGKRYVIKVGDDVGEAIANGAPRVDADYAMAAATQIERKGDTVAVARDFKDHLLKESLGKILMQAAAVPNMVNGRLNGFQLWDIEAKSIFEIAGLRDGDIVTAVNGLEITNVGSTIKQLNSLRNAQEAQFDFIRNGIKQNLKIVVQ